MDGFVTKEGDLVFAFEVDEFGDGVFVLGGEEEGDLLEGGGLDAGVVGEGFEVETGFDDCGVEVLPGDPASVFEIDLFPEVEEALEHFEFASIELVVPVLEVLFGIVDKFQESEFLGPFIKLIFEVC